MSDDTVTVEIELERDLLDKIESRSTAGRYGFEPQAQGIDTGIDVETDCETADGVSRRGLSAPNAISYVMWALVHNQLGRLRGR